MHFCEHIEQALIGLYQVNTDYKSGPICGTGCEKTSGATGIGLTLKGVHYQGGWEQNVY